MARVLQDSCDLYGFWLCKTLNSVESRIKRQLIEGFCGFTYRDAVRKKLLKTFRHKLPFFLSGILRTQGFLIKFLNKSC